MKIFFLSALVLLVLLAESAEPNNPSGAGIRIEAPAVIAAGDETGVTVSAFDEDGTAVTLMIADSNGSVVLESRLTDNVAYFSVPARSRNVAGNMTLIASTGGSQAVATIEVLAGPIVGPVVPLLGSRSVTADRNDRAMLAVIPEDVYGNPQPNGTVVTVNVRRQHGMRSRWTTTVEDGLAWTWIPATTRTGMTSVSVFAGFSSGPTATLQEVPGAPESFTLSADRSALPADGESLVTVETSELRDRYGNRLLDGTAVVFTSNRSAAVGTATAPTVGGVARTIIRAPQTAGPMTVAASVADVRSSPIEITFEPFLGTEDLDAAVVFGDDKAGVTVGPVLTTDGHYVADGTRVQVDSAGSTLLCQTQSGACSVDIFGRPQGPLTVTVGDRTTAIGLGGTS